MTFPTVATLFIGVSCLATSLYAAPITIDFDGFADGESLTTQVAGLTLTHATVLTAGVSLNEFEFPPGSGVNAVIDDGGPLSIVFGSPVLAVRGRFTYAVPLTVQAFDTTNALVATATSAFASDLALSGDPASVPNELLEILFAGGIGSLTVAGDPLGDSFVLDDLTITPSFPERGAFVLLLIGSTALGILRRRPRADGDTDPVDNRSGAIR